MSALFIAGTGTDIGKTFLTAALLRFLCAAKIEISALKPVVSGFDPDRPAQSDPGLLLAAMELALDAQALDAISPFRFAAPLSPDMAARREGRVLHLADVVAVCRVALDLRETVLIEGVGGLCSPVAEDGTNLDLAAALGLPILLVAGSYLGAISHTLTAVAAAHGRSVRVTAVVVNESVGSPVALEETADTIARFLDRANMAAPIVILPRCPSVGEEAARMLPIAAACGLMGKATIS